VFLALLVLVVLLLVWLVRRVSAAPPAARSVAAVRTRARPLTGWSAAGGVVRAAALSGVRAP
jgi:uncharacterized membrane-anchored protein